MQHIFNADEGILQRGGRNLWKSAEHVPAFFATLNVSPSTFLQWSQHVYIVYARPPHFGTCRINATRLYAVITDSKMVGPC